VETQGYYTVRAGDLEADSIVRSCPEAGECGATDFEVARAAAVEGWMTDKYGDPLPDVQIALAPEGADQGPGSGPRTRSSGGSRSDDRGYFRIWGLRPGRYELTAQRRDFVQGAPRTGPEKRLIEIAPGETSVQTRMAVGSGDAEVFSISGVVSGLSEEREQRRMISIRPAPEDGNAFLWSRGEAILAGGVFKIQGLAKGRYILQLAGYGRSQRQLQYLDTLEVDQDIEGLDLTPKPPTGLRGHVEFVEAPAATQFISASPPGAALYGGDGLEARAPDYTFETSGMAPGEYKLRVRNPDYYLVDQPFVTVTQGQMRDLVLRVSNQFSTIRGTVRRAGGEGREAAAHFTVGLRGERGRRTARADDAGGFVFERVIPGEYDITAWEALEVDVQDDEVWRRAGGARQTARGRSRL
jgi:protocatechuate 3,4-dioxygenase beta subunit